MNIYDVSSLRVKNDNVDKFFEILEKALETRNFTPDRVFNIDEAGLTIVVYVVCSHDHEAERVADFGRKRDRVDVHAAAFACGQFIPSWLLSLLHPIAPYFSFDLTHTAAVLSA